VQLGPGFGFDRAGPGAAVGVSPVLSARIGRMREDGSPCAPALWWEAGAAGKVFRLKGRVSCQFRSEGWSAATPGKRPEEGAGFDLRRICAIMLSAKKTRVAVGVVCGLARVRGHASSGRRVCGIRPGEQSKERSP